VAGYITEYSIGDHPDLIACIQEVLPSYMKPFLVVEMDDLEVLGPRALELGIGESIPLHYDSEAKLDEVDGKMVFKSRIVIGILYLQTLEDGATLFPVQKKEVTSEAGKLVLFPSGFMYPHLVTPPMSQVRRVLRFVVAPRLDNFIVRE